MSNQIPNPNVKMFGILDFELDLKFELEILDF